MPFFDEVEHNQLVLQLKHNKKNDVRMKRRMP